MPFSSLGAEDHDRLTKYFDENVYPVLTPLAVDPGHPFPMISNLSLNIAVYVRDDVTGEERSARVKVPNSLPRFLQANENEWCLLEDLITSNLGRLFSGMTVGRADLFRVTRNADLTLEEDEADDLLVALEVELRRRRFGEALRVEIQSGMSPEFLELLVDQLELDRSNVYVTDAPLGLHDLWSLYAIDRPDLKGEGWSPITPRRLLDGEHVGDIFAAIREDDILLHHPYESFTDSVEMFIAQAAADPKVVGIKMTLYRTSGDSPIVASLLHAARAGQAGRGARGVEGAIRRGGQHRVGEGPGRRGRPRGLRHRRSEDALQDRAGAAQRRRHDRALRPHRHRQLQRQDRADLRGLRPVDLRPGDHRRRGRTVQLPHRLLAHRQVQEDHGEPAVDAHAGSSS